MEDPQYKLEIPTLNLSTALSPFSDLGNLGQLVNETIENGLHTESPESSKQKEEE